MLKTTFQCKSRFLNPKSPKNCTLNRTHIWSMKIPEDERGQKMMCRRKLWELLHLADRKSVKLLELEEIKNSRKSKKLLLISHKHLTKVGELSRGMTSWASTIRTGSGSEATKRLLEERKARKRSWSCAISWLRPRIGSSGRSKLRQTTPKSQPSRLEHSSLPQSWPG